VLGLFRSFFFFFAQDRHCLHSFSGGFPFNLSLILSHHHIHLSFSMFLLHPSCKRVQRWRRDGIWGHPWNGSLLMSSYDEAATTSATSSHEMRHDIGSRKVLWKETKSSVHEIRFLDAVCPALSLSLSPIKEYIRQVTSNPSFLFDVSPFLLLQLFHLIG
jgi:hypothetical protein